MAESRIMTWQTKIERIDEDKTVLHNSWRLRKDDGFRVWIFFFCQSDRDMQLCFI